MSKANESKRPLRPEDMNGKKAGTTALPLHEIEFVLECIGAQQAYVCGDFNRWQPVSMRVIGNPDAGLWEKTMPLAPGRYEYKFFVDGKWMHDPEAPENAPNVYGSLNSVLEVRP